MQAMNACPAGASRCTASSRNRRGNSNPVGPPAAKPRGGAPSGPTPSRPRGAFAFTSQTLGHCTLDTATGNGTAQQGFADLPPGSYSVAETVPAGWQLQSATCSDGSNPANINIGPGENVTCTFTNRKLDTIVIVKQAVGGDATFAFSSTALGVFDQATVNGETQRSFTGLTPGVYDVTESGLAGWTPKVAEPVCS